MRCTHYVRLRNIMSDGVMGSEYAAGRERAPHLIFRLKARALTVASLTKKYLTAPHIRLLDFGSAEGKTLIELRSCLGEGEYLGIEASRELLSCAPDLPDGITVLHGDVNSLPEGVQENHFDAVTALALFEHLSDPSRAVREAFRVIRPGGILLATCPVPFWDNAAGSLGLLKNDHHEGKLDRAALMEIITREGFEILEYRKFMWAPAGILPYLRMPLTPAFSCRLDRFLSGLRVFDWLFVNQCIAARKPFGSGVTS